jgi:hypothetical protein
MICCRVAKKYIDLEHLAIVIVGDRSAVEAPLKATNIRADHDTRP